ncbi:hypothetical protein KFE25_003874 [Diacronema lutheri]|uniref:THIF-type NAD/FAD binding fold domain-containing protein n=1 Tax=Diacronema lutheri TaxID=2081491 RepID=A0A8J5X8I8_DIALT|nr:hypothetical protein KFE25_003874 [Diacronema lutheri]
MAAGWYVVLVGVTPSLSESAYSLRFRGVSALYGERALESFRASHVAIVGIGGVGSWAAEAIARTGVGAITVVDLDEVCISNTNRQLHSLVSTVGHAKADVLERRIREINPECAVRADKRFITPDNVHAFLADAAPAFSAVIDAVDGVQDKAALIDACVRLDVPIVTVGAAGGKLDPTTTRAVDISRVHGDSLMQSVRRLLRSEYAYPPETRGRAFRGSEWGIIAVSSPELAPRRSKAPTAPSCDQFGTATHVTGTLGFAAAAVVAGVLADGDASEGGHYRELRERIGVQKECGGEGRKSR